MPSLKKKKRKCDVQDVNQKWAKIKSELFVKILHVKMKLKSKSSGKDNINNS